MKYICSGNVIVGGGGGGGIHLPTPEIESMIDELRAVLERFSPTSKEWERADAKLRAAIEELGRRKP